MHLLTWVDNRTVLACQILQLAVFSFAFLGMKRTYPQLPGPASFTLHYVCGLLGCILLAARGTIPDVLSIVVANLLIIAAYIFMYRGVLEFLRIPRPIYPLWIALALTVLPLTYFTLVDNRILPRILLVGLFLCVPRLLAAIPLFRTASGKPFRLRFAIYLSLYTAIGLIRVVLSILHGAPANLMAHDSVQTATLFLDLVFVCIMGIFLLMMLSKDLLITSEHQSHLDALSGTLNRRGIEHKLAIELKRLERSTQRLSVALIDIDNFKAINDRSGHAAGDAALLAVVEAISTRLRAYDILGRFGGDEFLLILPHTACHDAITVADRIDQQVRAASLPGIDLLLTISIGITEAVPAETAAELLARADQALYNAKDAGRSCRRVLLHQQHSQFSDNESSLIAG